jgi:hypothetical protein
MPARAAQTESLPARRSREIIVRRRRIRFLSVILVLVLAAGLYAILSSGSRGTAQVSDQELLVSEKPSEAKPVDASGEDHPVFARLAENNLVLPVAAQYATIIAYEPTSDERALPLTPIGAQVNGGVLGRWLGRAFSGRAPIRYYVLPSSGRVVSETAAVDVGAAPGTPVCAPVSGQVVGVKSYQLYGKYDDVQIDIKPEGASEVLISILLVDEPQVQIGQTVEAGKTQLGKVRDVQGETGQLLAGYTHDSGGHVHLQATQSPLQ